MKEEEEEEKEEEEEEEEEDKAQKALPHCLEICSRTCHYFCLLSVEHRRKRITRKMKWKGGEGGRGEVRHTEPGREKGTQTACA